MKRSVQAGALRLVVSLASESLSVTASLANLVHKAISSAESVLVEV